MPGSGEIWLEGVDCNRQEAKIHDCPAAMRNRVNSMTGRYQLTKGGLPHEQIKHAIGVGVRCWVPLPDPPIAPTVVVVAF